MKIEVDVPVEVREGQYKHLIEKLESVIFHRIEQSTEGKKYFIKLVNVKWAIEYAEHYLEATEIKK